MEKEGGSQRSGLLHQLIDKNLEYHPEALTEVIEELGECGKDYFCVSIIGVQNSGKSTLLNELFGTHFEVLSGSMGNRTTRGILLSADKQEHLIVMDVEGNDSQESQHGDNDYEKTISSFALATAHVLIINVNSRTLGQYSGTQYESLNIIFKICMNQFRQEAPKVILFVIRDFNPNADDAGQIRRKIINDVKKIWQDVQKPEELKKYQNTPEKFFIIEVSVLSQYDRDAPEEFKEDVARLRRRFVEKQNDEYLFKRQNKELNLPVGDLPALTGQLWKSLRENKNLNLPHQKLQLAGYRCKQILNDVKILQFKTIAQYSKELDEAKEVPVDLGNLLSRALKTFRTQSHGYNRAVADEQEVLLHAHFQDRIKSLVHHHIDVLGSKLQEKFVQKLQNIHYDPNKKFQKQAEQLSRQILEQLSTGIRHLNYEFAGRKQVGDKLAQKLKLLTEEEAKRKIIAVKREIDLQSQRQMGLLSARALKEHLQLNFWPTVAELLNVKKQELFGRLDSQMLWVRGVRLSANQFDQLQEDLVNKLKTEIKGEFDKNLLTRLCDYFLKKFKFNEDDIPHDFKLLSQEMITQIFLQARQMTQNLLDALNNFTLRTQRRSSYIQIEDFAQGNGQTFMDSNWLLSIKEQVQNRATQQFDTVMRKKNEAQMRRVPWYLILIIAYFVYDDIWFTAAEYPFIHYTLTFFIIIVIFFFVIGLGDTVHQALNLFANLLKNLFSGRTSKITESASKISDQLKEKANQERLENSQGQNTASNSSKEIPSAS